MRVGCRNIAQQYTTLFQHPSDFHSLFELPATLKFALADEMCGFIQLGDIAVFEPVTRIP